MRKSLIYRNKKIGYTLRCSLSIFKLSLSSYYLVTEWHKSQNHQLEVLQAEWDADDGAAEDNAHCQVTQRHLDTTKDNPEDVEHQRHTAHRLIALCHLATKWPEGKHTQLHHLDAEWNTNDSEAEHQTTDEVAQREEQTSENYPDNVTDKIHILYSLG